MSDEWEGVGSTIWAVDQSLINLCSLKVHLFVYPIASTIDPGGKFFSTVLGSNVPFCLGGFEGVGEVGLKLLRGDTERF